MNAHYTIYANYDYISTQYITYALYTLQYSKHIQYSTINYMNTLL